MTNETRYCPTVEIPTTIADKHPNCFALITEVAGRMAVVDPDMQPKANSTDIAYLIVGRHAYASRFFRFMGQIVLTNHGLTFPDKAVEIAGTVIWFNIAHERVRSNARASQVAN